MPNYSGNTAATSTSAAYTIPMQIGFFSLANKTGGGITVTVGLVYGSTFDILYNNALTAAGTAGCGYVYTGAQKILLPTGSQIFVSVSGSCDFVFSLNPLQ